MSSTQIARDHALAIWRCAVEAVDPEPLVREALSTEKKVWQASRVLVVGAGKAGPGMAVGLESAFVDHLERVEGLINVPHGMTVPLKRIRLHPARPQGVNEPRPEGVAGAEAMIELLATAGDEDIAICLLSGGGSALLPAPVPDISLSDKIAMTKLLHRSGATIDEMNCVRKHLSRVKGGRLSENFRGKLFLSLIISDVVGDPLDVIASGPTAPDPTSFRDAQAVLSRHHLVDLAPPEIVRHLNRGSEGAFSETPKSLPSNVVNRVIGSNRIALNAAKTQATKLGYSVLDLGSFIEGETQHVATAIAGLIRSIKYDRAPLSVPVCLLIGGETTVTLSPQSGQGGRNQEFVLACLAKLGREGARGVTLLSAGTDGEDGPTDAAGAIADELTLASIEQLGLSMQAHLLGHNAYPLFQQTGSLLKTGLTGTNVMDVRVILIR